MNDLTYTLNQIDTACAEAEVAFARGGLKAITAEDDLLHMARTALPELAAEVKRLRADYAEAQETYAALHASWEAAEAALARVREVAKEYDRAAALEGYGGELWSTTAARIHAALKETP